MIWYNYINAGLLIIIWLIILSNFSKHKKERLPWILFMGSYTITEFISIIFEIYGKNNLWIYNISKPVQFFFLIQYFLFLLKVNSNVKSMTFLFTLLVFIPLVLFKGFIEYNSLFDITFSSVILILCILYFYQLISNDDESYPLISEFWFCTSLLIFFGVNLCINGTLNFLLKTQFVVARKLFYLLVINSYLFYLLIIYALLVSLKKIKFNGR
jgi:hypothetical protein